MVKDRLITDIQRNLRTPQGRTQITGRLAEAYDGRTQTILVTMGTTNPVVAQAQLLAPADPAPIGTSVTIFSRNGKTSAVLGSTPGATSDFMRTVLAAKTTVEARAVLGAGSSSAIGCQAQANLAFTWGTGSYTAVPFANASGWYTDGFKDPVGTPTRITIPTGYAGVYLINFWIDHSVSTGAAYIRKNGSTFIWGYSGARFTAGSESIYEGMTVLYLAEADYIEVMLNIASGTFHNGRFVVARLGEA